MPVTVIQNRNGFRYRCIVKSGTTQVASSVAMLTVSTPVAITTQPKSVTAAVNSTANFTVVATGSSLTYQWQYSRDGGTTWANCTGTGSLAATMPVVAIQNRNGFRYRCIVKSGSSQVTSNVAMLTVR